MKSSALYLIVMVLACTGCRESTEQEELLSQPLESLNKISAPEKNQHTWIMALALGSTIEDVQKVIREGIHAHKIKILKDYESVKENMGAKAKIHTYELKVLGKAGGIDQIRLSLFNNRLVGMIMTYRTPNPHRLEGLKQKWGEGKQSKYWMGWWIKDEHKLVQMRLDGMQYEIFDIGVAREVVPGIESPLKQGWAKRYGEMIR